MSDVRRRRPDLPQKLEESIKKVLSREGFLELSAYDDLFYEVPSEEDLSYIAKTMQDWQVLLPTLGMTFQDGRDIENDASLKSPLQKRIAVLMEFYSIHSDDATYNKLMLAFFKEQKMDLVSKVIEKAISRWKHDEAEEDVQSTVDKGVLAAQDRESRSTAETRGSNRIYLLVAAVICCIGGGVVYLLLPAATTFVTPKRAAPLAPERAAPLAPHIPSGGSAFPSHPIEVKLHLFSALGGIGKWQSLCLFLGVSDGVIDNIKHSGQDVTIMRQECLEHYFNNNNPNWGKVVTVVARQPIGNKKLACQIAKKYMHIDTETCQSYLDIHEEL